jgi:hypothetical protein
VVVVVFEPRNIIQEGNRVQTLKATPTKREDQRPVSVAQIRK